LTRETRRKRCCEYEDSEYPYMVNNKKKLKEEATGKMA
jgi:hypothetical protein